jgi:cystathionine beta-synthase
MELAGAIGNTKLIDLTWLIAKPGVSVFAKCEYLNPTGSIKDRIAAYMVQKAEESGHCKPGDTLIESTSGNTGAAVAMIAAIKGYKALLVMPDRVSQEKQAMLHALGAAIQMMPHQATIDSPDHYINRARQLAQTTPNSFYINQYHSLHNAAAHYHSTGPEIWAQMQGDIDVFLSVAGSGGTISGVGRYLKEKKPDVKIIALDPIGSVYRRYFRQGILPRVEEIFPSLVEGAGEDHLTASMDCSVLDDVMSFCDDDAFGIARWLAQKTGILTGGSSGANIWGTIQIAQQATKPMRIVTLLPDSGMKYLSKFYSDQWMAAQGFEKYIERSFSILNH